MPAYVSGSPYNWPYDGDLTPENTAILVIDMQVDFCGKGGYVDQMGYDLSLVTAPIEPIKAVLAAARGQGYKVIHTREGHRPDLSDLFPNKKFRSKAIGATIGEKGAAGRVLTRGEPGWEIIPDLAPAAGEDIIDKPGKGSFYATDLDLLLRKAGVKNLVLSGITTDVCVHTTMRDANDRGYECLLLEDCCGATDPANHAAAISMVKMQGGVFGSVATSAAFIKAISPAAAANGVSNGVPLAFPPKTDRVVRVKAEPYDYELPVGKTAVIMIDFQRDFMLPGGFGAALGNKVELLLACIPGAQKLLEAVRAVGIPVVHTMEAHKADLSDLHPCKLTRGHPPVGMRIGDKGAMGRILIRGEFGDDIMDDVAPAPGELLLYKPGKGAFYNTELTEYLEERGITHLLFAGVTTEVCVQTTMREANDRGYESCLIKDASESYFPEFKESCCKMIIAQGGIVGWVSDSTSLAEALAE